MLTRDEKTKLARLIRRTDHLAKRIMEAKADGRDLSFDKAELGALVWAVDKLDPDSETETGFGMSRKHRGAEP